MDTKKTAETSWLSTIALIVMVFIVPSIKSCNDRYHRGVEVMESKRERDNFIFFKSHGVGLSIRRLPGHDFKHHSKEKFFGDIARDKTFGSVFSREELSGELASMSPNVYHAEFEGGSIHVVSMDILDIASDELKNLGAQEIKKCMDEFADGHLMSLTEFEEAVEEAVNKKLRSEKSDSKNVHTEVKIVERMGNTVVFCIKIKIGDDTRGRTYEKYILDIKNCRLLLVCASISAEASAQDRKTIKSCIDSAHLFDENEK